MYCLQTASSSTDEAIAALIAGAAHDRGQRNLARRDCSGRCVGLTEKSFGLRQKIWDFRRPYGGNGRSARMVPRAWATCRPAWSTTFASTVITVWPARSTVPIAVIVPRATSMKVVV